MNARQKEFFDEKIRKAHVVNELSHVYSKYFYNVNRIDYYYFTQDGTDNEEEFIMVTYKNLNKGFGSNDCNSVYATAELATRMVDGGVYQNEECYTSLIEKGEWNGKKYRKEIDTSKWD